jgi:beta-lactam-binding protein with PASTA domain
VVEGPKKDAVVTGQKPFDDKGIKKIKLITANVNNDKPVKEQSNKMPDLKGMSLRKCIKVVSAMGIDYKVNGFGKVTKQSPEPGNILSKNQVVIINCAEQETSAGQ